MKLVNSCDAIASTQDQADASGNRADFPLHPLPEDKHETDPGRPSDARHGESMLEYYIRTGKLDSKQLRAKGHLALADELEKQTQSFARRRELSLKKQNCQKCSEEPGLLVIVTDVNVERDEYDAAKKMIKQLDCSRPFKKCSWFVFGLTSDQVANMVDKMIDIDGIICGEHINERLMSFTSQVSFDQEHVSAVK